MVGRNRIKCALKLDSPSLNLIICWLRLPNPRAVIISLFLNGARIARGILTVRDAITDPNDLAGPADVTLSRRRTATIANIYNTRQFDMFLF